MHRVFLVSYRSWDRLPLRTKTVSYLCEHEINAAMGCWCSRNRCYNFIKCTTRSTKIFPSQSLFQVYFANNLRYLFTRYADQRADSFLFFFPTKVINNRIISIVPCQFFLPHFHFISIHLHPSKNKKKSLSFFLVFFLYSILSPLSS